MRKFLAIGAVVGAIALACAPTPNPAVKVEPFTVIFIGDSEMRMQGNTAAEVAGYVNALVDYRTTTEAFFDYDGGDRHRIDPELVLLGGDISLDRSTSIAEDMPVFQPLYDNGIAFIAGFGNHDWEKDQWPEGPGYSFEGHLSNESTSEFTAETYTLSALTSPDFSYTPIGPTGTHGPVSYHAEFRGLEIVNFNMFLYLPSYEYPAGWPTTCNPAGNGAGCQSYVSADAQIAAMEAKLAGDRSNPVLFFQHYPVSGSDSWWDDDGASGTTVVQKKNRLLEMIAAEDDAILLAGHQHLAYETTHAVGADTVQEYVAPYFGGDGGDNPARGGGFVAMLVSPTDGILEVKTIPAGG